MSTNRSTVIAATIAVALAVGFGACSSSSDSSGSNASDSTAVAGASADRLPDAASPDASGVDPCDLVTVEDIAPHFDGELALDEGTGALSGCTYNSVEETEMKQVQVQFNPIGDLQGTPFEDWARAIAKPLDNTEITPVDGLGKAALMTSGGLIPAIFVETGDGIVMVGVIGSEDDDAAAKDLAATAIERL